MAHQLSVGGLVCGGERAEGEDGRGVGICGILVNQAQQTKHVLVAGAVNAAMREVVLRRLRLGDRVFVEC